MYTFTGLLSPELQVGDIVISSDLVTRYERGSSHLKPLVTQGLPVFSFTADKDLVEHALLGIG